jgi:hypothetical protein
MKRQMMCLIAALSTFTLPVDATEIANQSIPITLSLPVPWAGEVVDLSGTLDTVITFNPRHRRHGKRAMWSSWGKNAPFRLHVNAQGVAGTGEITGRAYQANGEWIMNFNTSLLNGQGTTSFDTSLEFDSAPGPDGSVIRFWIDETVHVTFNADGTVIVNVDNFSVFLGNSSTGFWDY